MSSTRNSKKKSGEAPAVTAATSSELRGVVDRIRRLKAVGTRRSALGSYAIGVEVQTVAAEPAKYGLASKRKAVLYLADRTKLSVDTIYNALKVAVAWPNRQDFARLLKREGKDGARLTFAHFVEALKFKATGERDANLERALAEDWSSDDVRAAARPAPGPGDHRDEAQPEVEAQSEKVAAASTTPSEAGGPMQRLMSAGRQALEDFRRMAEDLDALDGDLAALAEASDVLEQLGNLCLEFSASVDMKGAATELAAIEDLDEEELERDALAALATSIADDDDDDDDAAALRDHREGAAGG